MKKAVLVAICVLFISALTACGFNLFVPKTVTIENVTYRNGFYGDLWPENLTYVGDSYEVGANEFRRVDCEQFDWVHSAIGDTSNGVLYCAEDQWEQARAYYADSDTFVYYCKIGAQYVDRDPTITVVSDMDPQQFDALMAFADTNSYNPFGSNEDVKTRRLPIPSRDESPAFVFYRESNDGFFTSFKGNTFHVIDGRLFLVFYYDYGFGEYEELVAVDVPDEVGQYFIKLLGQSTA
jgi:hypothetical protein